MLICFLSALKKQINKLTSHQEIQRLFTLLDRAPDPHQLRTTIVEKLEELPVSKFVDGLVRALPTLSRNKSPWVYVVMIRQINEANHRDDSPR